MKHPPLNMYGLAKARRPCEASRIDRLTLLCSMRRRAAEAMLVASTAYTLLAPALAAKMARIPEPGVAGNSKHELRCAPDSCHQLALRLGNPCAPVPTSSTTLPWNCLLLDMTAW